MERIKLTCSNCGGNLSKIETQKDTYICLHCGKQEIIKEEVVPTNYFINQNITKNIYGNEDFLDKKYYKFIETAEKFWKIGDYKKALSYINQAIQLDEGNYLGWWLSVKVKLTCNIYFYHIGFSYSKSSIEQDYKKAFAFADDNTKAQIKHEYDLLLNELALLDKKTTEESVSQSYVVDAYVGDKENMEKTIKRDLFLGIFFLFGSLFVFVVLLCLGKELIIQYILAVLLGVVGVIWFIILRSDKIDKQIIEFIYTKKSLRLDEIAECYNSKFLIKKYVKNANYDELNNRIAYLIRAGRLVGYKLEKATLIKVDKNDN